MSLLQSSSQQLEDPLPIEAPAPRKMNYLEEQRFNIEAARRRVLEACRKAEEVRPIPSDIKNLMEKSGFDCEPRPHLNEHDRISAFLSRAKSYASDNRDKVQLYMDTCVFIQNKVLFVIRTISGGRDGPIYRIDCQDTEDPNAKFITVGQIYY
jgi:hypothetical protein